MQCLARKVEWGFPDAIFDLGSTGGPDIVEVLRKLTTVGDTRDEFAGLDTIRGRAQWALARLGDEEQFKNLVTELDDEGFEGAIKELQQIGGRRAVQALPQNRIASSCPGPWRRTVAAACNGSNSLDESES